MEANDKSDGEMTEEECHGGDGIHAQEGGVAWCMFERKGAGAHAFVLNLEVRREENWLLPGSL